MSFEVQWPLVFFSLLAGSGGTLACFLGLSELTGRAKEGRFVGSIVSLVLVVVGGCCSVLHLALPQNVMAAATNIFSFSGVSVELIMIGITFVVVFVYLVILVRVKNDTALKVFAVLGIVSGLVLAFVCGHGYVIESRHYWDTNLLPFAYLGSVLPVGAFAYLLIARIKGASLDDIASFRVWIVVAAVLSVVSMIAYMAFCGAEVLSRDLLNTVGLMVVCGMVGVVACTALSLKPSEKTFTAVASVAVVLALLGGLGTRVLMWEASDGWFEAWYIEENNIMIGTDDY